MLATAPILNRRPPPVSSDRQAIQSVTIDSTAEENLTELDARGPTPPKPVPAILAVLKGNPAGRPQFVRTAEAPVELLRALELHGVEAYPTQLPDGSWRTLLILGACDES